MSAWQDYISLMGPLRPGMSIRIVLCVRCQRMELADVQDGRVIRVSYWDDTPVLHK